VAQAGGKTGKFLVGDLGAKGLMRIGNL